jgi:SAM-dependent methyltransferase
MNNVDVFVEADLNLGVPNSVSGPFDVVVAGDVLEHLVSPHTLLASVRRCLTKDGSLFVSVPNFAHWYPRLRVLTGTFDYDQRGIIDSGHVRFFTRKSFKALVERAGYQVVRSAPIGLPLSIVSTQKNTSRLKSIAVVMEKLVLSVWPSMFAYQFVLELKQSKIRTTESTQ